jgi:transcriptional regulator with XRE-family HTH domain
MKRLSLPVNKIKKLYLEGWTITKLAERYYCSYFAMRVRILDMGILREKKRIFISPSELKDTYELQGLTLQEIADAYGVSLKTIIRRKKKSWKDIETHHSVKTTPYTPMIVHYLRREKKMKIREVAEIMGLTQRTICNLQKIDIEELRKRFIVQEK